MNLPPWITAKEIIGLHSTKKLLRSYGVSTVCEAARCPNKGYCFSKPTATFLILGQSCTRNCGFCSVEKAPPLPVDPSEPERIARASKEMSLKHVVITSVSRDDLPDGGARHFARTICTAKGIVPGASVEVLTPDFMGRKSALEAVLEAGPDVYNHNIETVPRLYPRVRPQADYQRSLNLLKSAKDMAPRVPIKSGLMVGIGEKFHEVISVMRELRHRGCSVITIGQYLRPSKKNLPVVEYIHPDVFEEYRSIAYDIGFKHIASGPLVRSSMNAENIFSRCGNPNE